MIKIEHISKSYNKVSKAVDDLSLEIKDGEIFGILGPNGSGKTTTLKMLTGSLSIDSGSIKINGYDITNEPLLAKREFGFVPDSPDMFLKLTGLEYLHFLATVYKLDPKYTKERIEFLSEKFEMKENLMNKLETYSHGMRQKMVLIGALLHNPKVWILDEPMTGLDPKSSHTLKMMMREHADQGNAVIFSTHVLEVAEKVCDSIGIIKEGKLIFAGSLEDMKKERKSDSSLEDMFLEMTDND